MPEISRFFGIVIALYHNDHGPPHFHAKYAGKEAIVAIDTLRILEGRLPRRARGLVLEWAWRHRDELLDLWDLARAGHTLHRIAPLG